MQRPWLPVFLPAVLSQSASSAQKLLRTAIDSWLILLPSPWNESHSKPSAHLLNTPHSVPSCVALMHDFGTFSPSSSYMRPVVSLASWNDHCISLFLDSELHIINLPDESPIVFCYLHHPSCMLLPAPPSRKSALLGDQFFTTRLCAALRVACCPMLLCSR